MWIARDKCGDLWFYTHKPRKTSESWVTDSSCFMALLPMDLFDIKWEDEPIEVSFTILHDPNKKYYEIIKKENFWFVIILSTEQTGNYWKYLLNDLKECEKPLYFDFLYRNGLNNRFYILDDKQRLKSVTKYEDFLNISFDYFTKNPSILQGSTLTKKQIREYVGSKR